MDTSKISNVLVFKEGYYWLTLEYNCSNGWYIVPKEWNIANGFEFPSDAYAYLHKLQCGEATEEGYNRIGADGIPDRV